MADLKRNFVYEGDALEIAKTLPDESVHCMITSPPYYGLRNYGIEGQMGQEESPEAYVERLVVVFRELRRVLRKDGTLWLNLADSYNGSGKGGKLGSASKKQATNKGANLDTPMRLKSFKPKDLIPISWMVAIALQKDGWYLRAPIIWSKPNPMPESMTDRVTISHEYVFMLAKSGEAQFWTHRDGGGTNIKPAPDYRWQHTETDEETEVEPEGWREQRLPNGEKMWRRFNLWSGNCYFYDADAIREPLADATITRDKTPRGRSQNGSGSEESLAGYDYGRRNDLGNMQSNASGRNKRSVWEVPLHGFKEAHFATFPEALIEPMILAGCPRHTCAICGAPYVGFSPSCACDTTETLPGIAYDPFMGAWTVAKVARRLGRDYSGSELNPAYNKIGKRRLRGTAPKEKMGDAEGGGKPVTISMFGDEE